MVNLKDIVFKKMVKGKTSANVIINGLEEVEYFYLKNTDIRNYLIERLIFMEGLFLELLKKDKFNSIYSKSINPFLTFGAITSVRGEKLTIDTIYIQNPLFEVNDINTDELIKCNLNELEQFSIFNGQIVALNCSYNNNELIVHNLYPFPLLEVNSRKKNDLNIIIAKGYFNSEYIDHLISLDPSVIILMGPFQTISSFKSFVNLLKKKIETIKYIKIILIPSLEDKEFFGIFPQMEKIIHSEQIICIRNPSSIIINNHLLAFNNCDILSDIENYEYSKINESHNDKFLNSSKIDRLCHHLLFQCSFLPTIPSQFCVSYSKTLNISQVPDIYIISSKFDSFIKDIGPSKIINIGNNSQKHIIIKYNELNKTYNIQ